MFFWAGQADRRLSPDTWCDRMEKNALARTRAFPAYLAAIGEALNAG